VLDLRDHVPLVPSAPVHVPLQLLMELALIGFLVLCVTGERGVGELACSCTRLVFWTLLVPRSPYVVVVLGHPPTVVTGILTEC
jgi:hypothetical protein